MSFNSTGDLFTSSTAFLYEGTDFSSLNYLERKWAAWYIWIGNPVIATGLLTFIVHELVYFGRSIPWIIVDAIPYFRRWKLQPNKVPTPAQQWECTKQVLFAHFTIEGPAIIGFHPLAEFFGLRTWQVPFSPFWTAMVPQILFFFVFEDMFHYWAHKFLHTPLMYKHIHKLHHKYSSPFGLAAEYAHPAEVAILGMGTVAGPLLYSVAMGDLHMVTMLLWITLRLFQAIDAHSGYDFPWSLTHIIPFWSGADHHDFHHMAFTNNYATSFRWWDYMLGTDTKYRVYRSKMAAAKEQLRRKGCTAEDERAMEQRINDETEIEGLRSEAAIIAGVGDKKTE